MTGGRRIRLVANMKSILAIGLLLIATVTSNPYEELSKPAGEKEDILALGDILELELDDQCVIKAEAEWASLNGEPNSLDEKLEAEKKFGYLARTQAIEMKDAEYTGEHDNPIINRKIQLIAHPGDTILETDKWNKLVSFREMAENGFQTATDIECGQKTCTMPEFLEFLAMSRDSELLSSAKKSWSKKLPDGNKLKTEILPLLNEVAKAEGYVTVEEYWENLGELDDAYIKAGHLWNNIESLYENLQKYVAMKFQKKDDSMVKDGFIPSYLLGSLFGEDWLNVADVILPNLHIYNEMNKNLHNRKIGGKEAFKSASSMLHRLNLKDLKDIFFSDSKFDKECPIRLVNFCRDGVKAFSCNQSTLPLFLDAHEAAMAVKHSELKASLSSNSYIFKEANRYSALDEAISGLGSLLAMTPHHLNNVRVLPLKVFNSNKEKFNNKIVLQMLLALRDLPRLAYYYAADRWRVEQVDYHVTSIWKDRRQNITRVIPSDNDYLADPYILSNKPYIGKFLGIILKYQLLEDLTIDIQDEEDIIEHISEGPKIRELMTKGFSQEWPAIISPIDIDSNALLNYFQPLSEFLLAELHPNTDESHNYDEKFDTIDDNDFKNVEDDNDMLDNFDVDHEDENKTPESEIITEKQKELEKNIVLEKAVNNPSEESTVKLDNNPNSIPKDLDGGSPAASSSDLSNTGENSQAGGIDAASLQYAWIALGVLALIIIILGIVIARKRYKHKKELERERRQGNA
ncbi:angiotensin-converting enzyme-like [Arctopsyche grandis]|uniref:angiotensin-converting enzyme-like n=1 Tax=Arctopsyche grandis TaxID=121162 RepID=UPI00406D6F59